MIVFSIFIGTKEPGQVYDLLEVEASQPVDLLDGVDGNIAFKEPGQLVDASLCVEVPCKDVLQVERDVLA